MSRQQYRRYNSSLTALTPEGIEFVLSPAGLPVRTLAYGIDKVIQWVILIIIYVASEMTRNSAGIWIFLILNFCVDWFYHVFFELTFHGKTPGKLMTGIRVIRSDGSPVDPASSFLRNIMRFADTFFFFYPIALFSMISSGGFKRIGDWAGGTLVVYSSFARNYPRTPLNLLLAKCDPVEPAYPLSNDEKQAIMSFARRYPLLGEARANEIAGIYAPYLRNASGNSGGMSDAACILGIARKLSGETR